MTGRPGLDKLPPPPTGKVGWPWTEESPQIPERMPDGSDWPLISVVTPSFNQSMFLEETIRSTLLQGYPRLEYFVMDGGSYDESLTVVKKYEPWLTGWVSEQDRGQSHAINKGFSRCSGELLTFQNSDDFYLAGAFQDVACLYRRNTDCGAIVGAFRRCDENSGLNEEVVPPRLTLPSPRDLTLGPPGIYRLHQVSTFYTKRVLDDVGRHVQEDLRYVMDRELLYRVCRRAKIVCSPKCYGVFRIHGHSKTVTSVLPFAREFAALYSKYLNGNPQQDLLRRRMARYHIAAGYLRHAKDTHQTLSAAWHLIRAAVVYTPLLKQRRYAAAWLRTLGLLKAT